MLLPTFIHIKPATHVKLIGHMNLTCFKNVQRTLTSLRNNKSTADLSQCLRNALFFFKSRRGIRSLSGYPGIVSSLCLTFHLFIYLKGCGTALKEAPPAAARETLPMVATNLESTAQCGTVPVPPPPLLPDRPK